MQLHPRTLHFSIQARNSRLGILHRNIRNSGSQHLRSPSSLPALHSTYVLSSSSQQPMKAGIKIHHYPSTSENRRPEKLHNIPQLQNPDTQTQLSKATLSTEEMNPHHATEQKASPSSTSSVSSTWKQTESSTSSKELPGYPIMKSI